MQGVQRPVFLVIQVRLKSYTRRGTAVVNPNMVKKIRESKMMSKAELARKANVTVQTIDRIEKGNDCRLDTKRKIILALGYKLGERSKLFHGDDELPAKKIPARGKSKKIKGSK